MSENLVLLKNADILQRKKPVLTGVNLEVNQGDFLYLIGSTGSGKSSLLKTLYGELPLIKGQGKVINFNLRRLKQKEIPFLRRRLGIVFQDFQLLNDRNVFNNLKFVLKATGWKNPKKIQQQIAKVLDQVGMIEKTYSLPHQLSGGEQQRIAIARALLNNPELILADEPTGNLDPETSQDIMQLLKHLNQNGQTVMMATHDYALIYQFPAATYKCDAGELYEVELDLSE